MGVNYSLYEILGLDPEATEKEVRVAYRRLAMRAHPDTGGTAAIFDILTDAYRTLGDPTRRSAYDAGRRPGSDLGSSQPAGSSPTAARGRSRQPKSGGAGPNESRYSTYSEYSDAWASFESDLARSIRRLRSREYRNVEYGGKYVQAIVYDGVIWAECQGPLAAGGTGRYGPRQVGRILDLGWPDIEDPPAGYPNYRSHWPTTDSRRFDDSDTRAAASLLVKTLREVFYAEHPMYCSNHKDRMSR